MVPAIAEMRSYMKIHAYCSKNGTDLIAKYIEGLTMNEQVDAYDVLEQLEKGNFEELKSKRWEGKVQEVYFYKHNRIFYVVVDSNNIYLLHACRKQKNKTERRDAKLIRARAKELSKIIDKDII